jgi:dTDP-4-dehydrorhamnose 3,5-epimerase
MRQSERDERFRFASTALSGVVVIQRQPRGDERGYLERLFCESALAGIGFGGPISQINHTLTRSKGCIRGMHFQYPPHAEAKLVSCLRGRIFDVAVDLRPDSPSFLRWHGEILGAANHKSLLIPPGCAHGFQTLTADCHLLYLHTAPFVPGSEGGVRFDDPVLAIDWPMAVTDISERDKTHPFIGPGFSGIRL